MPRINVAIVDDHAIVREGLRRLIAEQDDMRVAGEAWDGESACEIVRMRQVDVMLLDITMPQLGGLEALQKILRRSPATRVIVFTNCPARHFAAKAARSGAHGFVGKDGEPDEILVAIRTTASGHRYFAGEAAAAIAHEAIDGDRGIAPHENLTDREFQLLLRYARGQTSAEIARDLTISERTVSTYHGALLGKLGVASRSEMALYALRHGLID